MFEIMNSKLTLIPVVPRFKMTWKVSSLVIKLFTSVTNATFFITKGTNYELLA